MRFPAIADWIVPEKLLASRIPPDISYLLTLKDMGIGYALNLTERDWPENWKEHWGGKYLHIPVDDFGIPTKGQAERAVDFIVEGISYGAVMVHCFAGLGRTGTIIGVYLVESGMEPGDAVDLVRSRRPGSLEVPDQEEFVLNWRRRRLKLGN